MSASASPLHWNTVQGGLVEGGLAKPPFLPDIENMDSGGTALGWQVVQELLQGLGTKQDSLGLDFKLLRVITTWGIQKS